MKDTTCSERLTSINRKEWENTNPEQNGDPVSGLSIIGQEDDPEDSTVVSKEHDPLVHNQDMAEKMDDEDTEKKTASCWRCKYNWRYLMPVACCCRSPDLASFENSGFLEIVTASWVTSIIVKGFRTTIKPEDLGQLSKSMSAQVSKKRLMRFLAEEKAKNGEKDFSLGKVFWRTVRTNLVLSIFCLFLYLCLEFFSAAIILKNVLSYLEAPYGTSWDGIKWVVLLAVFSMSRSIIFSGVFFLQLQAGVIARAAALSFIYHKLSRLKSVGNKSVGELVNLCANDSQRIFECCQFCVFLFGAPLLAVLMSVYLYSMFGPSSLIGIGIMIMFLPIQAVIGKMIGRVRAKVIRYTDQRVKMINEMITSIKLIKMYGWEASFAKTIKDIRFKEKKLLVSLLFMQAVNMSMAMLLTSIAAVATFAAHIAFGNNLTVSEAFTIIVMFNIFPPNIALLPIAVRGVSEARNAMKRLKNLLLLEEFVPYHEEPSDPSVALSMKNCNFAWLVPQDEMDSKASKKMSKDEAKNATTRTDKDVNGKKEPHVEFKNGKSTSANGMDESEGTMTQLSPTLFDISLTLKKGSLIGVCGGVGAGKSSLLQAVLGQMHKSNGHVQVIKSSGYVPQQAWIVNDTLRNNITFGKEYIEKWYKECCIACALEKDLEGFESGDLTEIGERGINLSGGQKQRISLARALYADADLYLLDDPLSAVDAHVGKFIFTNYMKEKLHGKACIFVTHQLQYLQDCDEVIMMSNGRIVEHGTYTDLMAAQKEFHELINKLRKEEGHEMDFDANEISDTPDDSGLNANDNVKQENGAQGLRLRRTDSVISSISEVNSAYDSNCYDQDEPTEEEKVRKGKIITKEESSVGSVSWKVYSAFMKAGGGYMVSAIAVIFQIGVLVIISFVEWWLSKWLNVAAEPVKFQNTTRIMSLSEHPETSFFMTIYATVGSSMFLVQMISSMIFTFLFITASTRLHNDVLDSILKCPMQFFDTTPTGRILNRFSRDLDDLDGRLSWTVEALIRNASRILIALAFVAIILPWLLIGLVPLAVIFVALYMMFRRTNREIKRIDNVTRSPIFSQLTATVRGLPVLRAFNKTEYFQSTFDGYIDKNSLPLFLFFLSGRWFSVRLDVLCIMLSAGTALAAVLTQGSIPPAFAGLAIMYSLRITGLFQFTCRLAAETEARFTSVERMNHYTVSLEHEGPFEVTESLASWPCEGKIEFNRVNLRYRPNLPLVLKDVSLSIKAREKVGIAGRTGAGKSSLAVALFRLAEIDGGEILIDGTDISSMGLTQLRSGLSVIPQDPIMFIGTIRYNLDPFHQHTDEKLWLALEKAYMKDIIADLPLKLEALVVENGENFSVGERQLICMARALVQDSKILLLDEATAAIDSQTDAKIQITIRESFKDCTVLTIAHRLDTILTCDRIVVMDNGKVAEFDSPTSLMANKDSIFSKMVKTSNIEK